MDYEALCIIVNDAHGKRVLQEAKEQGMQGATVFYGQGTSENKMLQLLGLEEMRKECLLFISNPETTERTLRHLTEKFKMDRPGHGIAFTMSLSQILGFYHEPDLEEPLTTPSNDSKTEQTRKERDRMHEAIFVIVERGDSDRVLEAAYNAGSKGGTVIHARGSGVENKKRLFHMDIDPEKDVVLILSPSDQADKLCDLLHEELELDKPNHGVLFRVDLKETRGLVE